jgi:RNA polymerase sigma factor (sigma-70 family)
VTDHSAREPVWLARLAAGDSDAAWDAFLADHRRLLFATIGALVRDREDRMSAFAHVCERLRETDLRRLRAFRPDGPARFTTWLVTVVRHLVVDWHRKSHGRRRLDAALARQGPLRQRLFALLTAGRSYVEAFESLRSEGHFSGTFAALLREVRALYRDVRAEAGPLARELIGIDLGSELDAGPVHQPEADLDHQRIREALASLPDDLHAAILLFVVDDVPADQVARIVGWPGRKMVYNRVYRALAMLRTRLEGETPEQRQGPVRGMSTDGP